MSDIDLTGAIDDALDETLLLCIGEEGEHEQATLIRDAVRAAAPAIERAVRAQVVREIETLSEARTANSNALVPPNPMFGYERWAADALSDAAARIARGEYRAMALEDWTEARR